ncbi:MAG: hypothetical protein MI757_10120, partial [Pirellulales bacterium]|nr:hypothetical protein [Pirellulales bacterium]
QFMMAGIIGVIGIPFLYIYVSTRGKWIEMDDDGFSTSWGQRCEFDQITGFDKRKWYNKGIAVIRYDDNGKQRRLTLDDCKYDREPTELFVREVTLDLDEDQIIGGRATDYDDEEVDDENVEEESVVDEAEETSEEADVVDEKK